MGQSRTYTPSESRPGSAVKQRLLLPAKGRQDELPVKDLFAPSTSAAPIDVPTLKRKALRRRKAIPDGGYGVDKNVPQLSGMHPEPMISSSFATIVDPDNASTEEEGDGSLDSEEMIRCSCGTDRDGGTTMIQWWVPHF